ncbi:GntR family transcriptional regulator [Paenibacillus roseipurpureus]|uniref:GntR family transcriptional regulator n=1 Tax=Paenibacillus roseopurpureus TaxID=2918901 RepID=A0AA96LJM6_9BACL|nr:GntR family transcriptional regulator [Paenibacillus sp. MBLB1832]WNR42960.1 GntR family transcriptional regulator [Paenibacillus sp. MBLB1832]
MNAINGSNEATYSRVRDQLRQDIITGVFEPGVRLRIQELSNRYEVSQMPIREALQQLQGEGLITLLPQKGASVRKIDQKFVENMYDIRIAIETMLVSRGIDNLSNRELGLIEEHQAQYEAYATAGNMEGALTANTLMHHRINQLAENPEALDIINRHWGLIASLRSKFGFSQQRVQSIIEDHRGILEALRNRDKEQAVRLTRDHATKAKIDLLEQMSNQT